jgi:hypothetical protein
MHANKCVPFSQELARVNEALSNEKHAMRKVTQEQHDEVSQLKAQASKHPCDACRPLWRCCSQTDAARSARQSGGHVHGANLLIAAHSQVAAAQDTSRELQAQVAVARAEANAVLTARDAAAAKLKGEVAHLHREVHTKTKVRHLQAPSACRSDALGCVAMN